MILMLCDLSQLCFLQGDDLAPLICQPVEGPEKGEGVPEDEYEEHDKDPETYIPRTTKRPRGAAAGTEGSAKKAKTSQGGAQRRYDTKQHERARMNMLRAAGQGSQPTLPTSRSVQYYFHYAFFLISIPPNLFIFTAADQRFPPRRTRPSPLVKLSFPRPKPLLPLLQILP
jgi:hypothetical protein